MKRERVGITEFMRVHKLGPYRQDWMPQNVVEVCACIAVLAMQGRLSIADEQEIADYIRFRSQLRRQPHSTEKR